MLGWISILVGIVLIALNVKSVWDRTAPLRSAGYNKALASTGYAAAASDVSPPDPNTAPKDTTSTGYQAAPPSTTDTAPAPTPTTDTTQQQPANTSQVGSTSSIWPIQFFITTDVLGLLVGLLLIYLGYRIEFPPVAIVGGRRRKN